MSATLRMLERRGRSATITTYADDGTTDSQGDPNWSTSTSSTTALVDLPGRQDPVTVSIAGQEREIDAVVWVPKADAVDPAGEDRPPQIQVEGTDYRIGMLDPHVLGDVRRLLCSRMR